LQKPLVLFIYHYILLLEPKIIHSSVTACMACFLFAGALSLHEKTAKVLRLPKTPTSPPDKKCMVLKTGL
jgi:hypothetical protein